MKHNYVIHGLSYRLRPVCVSDAELILRIRNEDTERMKYVHPIPNDIELEKQWIEKYLERQGDYFFIIENVFTDEPEGLIGLYDERDNSAEWGRWTIVKGSMAAVESAYLIYQFAFQKRKLSELYCHTIKKNESVVFFHTSTGLKTRSILKDFYQWEGKKFDVVEQYLTNDDFDEHISGDLYEKCYKLFIRNLRLFTGSMEFHHMGLACSKIQKDIHVFQMLGYHFEHNFFTDELQGVRGIFGTAKGQPCIELLENVEGSDKLTPYIMKGQKIYHFAYLVSDMEKVSNYLEKGHAKLMSPMKVSAYFRKKICFYMLSNMLLIELIEK